MTDIVERLRCEGNSYRDVCNALGTADVMEEAADEIERLRAQMESGNFLTENDKLTLAIERQALEIKERDAEIERLREALVTFRSVVKEGGVPRYTVTPGAALNSVIEEVVDPILKRAR